MTVALLVCFLLAAALGAWVSYQLFLQNGRLLARIEKVEEAMREQGGLSPGRNADSVRRGGMLMDFALPSLDGDTITLSQWRGSRVLLIFFDPRCAFCMKMLPDLLALRPKRSDIGDAPAVLVVSKGSVEANGRLFAGRGAHLAVAIQDEGEVASVYGVNGTPMGCLVDEDGRAASELIAGADELLALAGIAGLRDRQGGGSARRRGAGPRITKSLDGSQLLRDGLKAGALAPDFTLPRIDGSELSLSRYRGRRVLLAFSDPNCGPCDALAPKLEDLHRRSRSSDPQILMISRGDVEANRRKIDELGLTFPIVLQRQWEISRSFGIFATPVGFLVREDGLLASDVAMGVESILHLAEDEAGSELRRAI